MKLHCRAFASTSPAGAFLHELSGTRLPVLLLFALALGCGKPSVVGTWEMEHQPIMGTAVPAVVKGTQKWTLDFKANGTFTEHFENQIMVLVIRDSSGTWSQSGSTVALKGTTKMYMDDGYRKETTTLPMTLSLELDGRDLKFRPGSGAMEAPAGHGEVAFRKK